MTYKPMIAIYKYKSVWILNNFKFTCILTPMSTYVMSVTYTMYARCFYENVNYSNFEEQKRQYKC